MESSKPKRLLLIISDRISKFVEKGELIKRYYNPGDYFSEVYLLLVNRDIVSLPDIKSLFGQATVSPHNLPRPGFIASLGWTSSFMKKWIDQGVQFARKIHPDVIRCYGNIDNGYLGAQIKKQLGIPLVVSLHINIDEDVRGKTPWWPTWKDRLVSERQKYFEKETLKAADWVLPVYEPIVEYAKKFGAKNIRVCYNMTNNENLKKKENYQLHDPVQLVSVGRQFKQGKYPINLIRAVSGLKAKLTLVGDGPAHAVLKRIASERRGPGEFEFINAMPNDELCRRLPQYDLFAVHTEYYEISKSVIEAMLTGLPVVLNRRRGRQVPELAGDWIRLVNDDTLSYRQAIQELLASQQGREDLGRRAYTHSQNLYAPQKTEQAYVEIYRSVLSAAHQQALR